MKITVRRKDDVAIMDLEGNIDINAADFVEKVGWILKNRGRDILCNFESVNLVDYVGISLIAVTYKNVLNHNGRISLYAVPSHVMKLFSLVGLHKFFTFHATEEAALTAMKTEGLLGQLSPDTARRRFTRIPLNLTVRYRHKHPATSPVHKGKIVNLSGEGILIHTDETYTIGDAVLIDIRLGPETGLIQADAKVIWLVDEEFQPQDYPGMGLTFTGLSTEIQERILQFVEKHLAHPPQALEAEQPPEPNPPEA